MTTTIAEELGRIPMSPFLSATLARAADYAASQTHREVSLEHLLLALAEDPEASIVLKSSNIDITRLLNDTAALIARVSPRGEAGQSVALSQDLKRILEAAAAAAQQGRRREINGAIVLAAIVGDGKSAAAHLLRDQGLTFEEAIRALQRAQAAAQRPQGTEAADGRQAPPSAPPTRPATTDEIMASARERVHNRSAAAAAPPPEPQPPAPASHPEHYQEAAPPRGVGSGGAAPASSPAPVDDRLTRYPERFEQPLSPAGAHPAAPAPAQWAPPPQAAPPPRPLAGYGGRPSAPPPIPPPPARLPPQPPQRTGGKGPGSFVGNWPLIEAGQIVENIPRRMRVGRAVVVEARVARADVKAIAEGLEGGGAAYRHEVMVTKAMSVRLRAPDGGFWIESRSPETQWIENVLGLVADDYASWRWTVTPRERGRKQLQLVVSARTVGGDGLAAETALPDQVIDVKVGVNYGRTLLRWTGWLAAAAIGGAIARFGETAYDLGRIILARFLAG